MMTEEKGGGVAWLALIIGVIALLLAWSSYNRTGGDLEAEVKERVREALLETGTLEMQVATGTQTAVTENTETSTTTETTTTTETSEQPE